MRTFLVLLSSMQSHFRASFLPLALVALGLSGAGVYTLYSTGGNPLPGTVPCNEITSDMTA